MEQSSYLGICVIDKNIKVWIRHNVRLTKSVTLFPTASSPYLINKARRWETELNPRPALLRLKYFNQKLFAENFAMMADVLASANHNQALC